ncbi:MAG: hypothetical protein KAS38_19415, partial [Anaerolineales bacterium]|nr:hypothetical protein [Anaerolineales bacterium]
MNVYKKLAHVLIVWILITMCAIPSASPIEAADPPPPMEGSLEFAQANWWATVQENIRKSEYHITWQTTTYLTDVLAAYQAPNRAQNLRSYFTSKGPIVMPRVWQGESESPPWRWEAQLVAWGRGQELQPVLPATLKVQDNLIEYYHGDPYTGQGLVEWYHNDESGLEQGFTLFSPPRDEPTGEPVQIDLVIGGSLTPQMTQDGTELEFNSHDGRAELRYGSPTAVDAAGRELRAWLSLDGLRLSLFVDDTN